MDTVTAAAVIFASYVLGGIPAAYIVGRLARGIDIRDVGTRNAGAANVSREVGRLPGMLVLVLDLAKGAAGPLIVKALDLPGWALYGSSVAAVLGHNFSPFLRFYGGKGVAVALGVAAVIMPLLTAVTCGPAVIAVMVLRRNVVIWFGVGALAFVIAMFVTRPSALDAGIVLTLIALVLATAYARAWREWHANIGGLARRLTSRGVGGSR
jgi:glycerol-3-phosphate acyltransferase PlsY